MTAVAAAYTVVLTVVLAVVVSQTQSEPTEDKQALQSFLSKVPHESRLQWNSSTSACTWVGVGCDSSNSHVYTLRLPAVGLVGPIPPNTIGRLSHLRVLSIHSNRLTSPLPSDFSNLTFLRALYIGHNNFSGNFPTSLTFLSHLIRLDLSHNSFSGPIPFSLNNLTRLTGLFLQTNNFSGPIPSISSDLAEFNVSDNNLNGSIPKDLSHFPASSFAGNLQLCGDPLPACNNTFFPPPSPSPTAVVPSSPAEIRHNKKLSKAAIIGISVAAAVVLLSLLICLTLCLLRRREKTPPKTATAAKEVPATAVAAAAGIGGEAGTSSSKDELTSGTGPGGGERNRLMFVNGGGYAFDLEDLLRASAEVLGKGSVGTSYKAVLEEGMTVVVKRLKDVVAGKRELETQMEMVGKCKHENVVALRAYYYSKDEKLLVYDYLPAGSLSALLHGNY